MFVHLFVQSLKDETNGWTDMTSNYGCSAFTYNLVFEVFIHFVMQQKLWSTLIFYIATLHLPQKRAHYETNG
jgi:hypothetical protein